MKIYTACCGENVCSTTNSHHRTQDRTHLWVTEEKIIAKFIHPLSASGVGSSKLETEKNEQTGQLNQEKVDLTIQLNDSTKSLKNIETIVETFFVGTETCIN